VFKSYISTSLKTSVQVDSLFGLDQLTKYTGL